MSLPYEIRNAASGQVTKGRVAIGKLKRVQLPIDFGTRSSIAINLKTSGTVVASGGGKLALKVANYDPSGSACTG
jgi:hypothetical protein